MNKNEKFPPDNEKFPFFVKFVALYAVWVCGEKRKSAWKLRYNLISLQKRPLLLLFYSEAERGVWSSPVGVAVLCSVSVHFQWTHTHITVNREKWWMTVCLSLIMPLRDSLKGFRAVYSHTGADRDERDGRAAWDLPCSGKIFDKKKNETKKKFPSIYIYTPLFLPIPFLLSSRPGVSVRKHTRPTKPTSPLYSTESRR